MYSFYSGQNSLEAGVAALIFIASALVCLTLHKNLILEHNLGQDLL